MQYETIILELLSRIKKLEEDVDILKRSQISSTSAIFQNDSDSLEERTSGTNVTYKKMTDEMIDICYKFGKKVFDGENPQELSDEIAYETGMNRNSAIMYLYAVSGMLQGTVYKRAISAKATQKYFDMIFNEYGSVGLKKAIKATKLHIDYRREFGHKVDSVEELCNRYENKI